MAISIHLKAYFPRIRQKWKPNESVIRSIGSIGESQSLKDLRPISCRCSECGPLTKKQNINQLNVEVAEHRNARIKEQVIKRFQNTTTNKSQGQRGIKLRGSIILNQAKLQQIRQIIEDKKKEDIPPHHQLAYDQERIINTEKSHFSEDMYQKIQQMFQKDLMLSMERVYAQKIKTFTIKPLSHRVSPMPNREKQPIKMPIGSFQHISFKLQRSNYSQISRSRRSLSPLRRIDDQQKQYSLKTKITPYSDQQQNNYYHQLLHEQSKFLNKKKKFKISSKRVQSQDQICIQNYSQQSLSTRTLHNSQGKITKVQSKKNS